MIAIIDYGSGNLRSIQRGLESHDVETVVTPDPAAIVAADAVVLPGVGNASHAMDQLSASGIADAILQVADAGKPFLGICVGMQVLFEAQEEGNSMGLGLLKGEVIRLNGSEKVPHIGWNISHPIREPLVGQCPGDQYYYFVHSYVARPADQADILAETMYGQSFPSAVKRRNVWGTQFHPERSGESGLAFLGLWVDAVQRWQRREAA